ncbi:outer membrane lipoprotein carrier protein LolA [Paenibacillus sp. MER TA 81-3]|uniref:LolA family protein n=1 Tax=Paenibacillus sp. MER TA 81-3 TaxID=2939573 RepID=UPI00203CE9BE|nr:outer membrane lipoprotein carrier protein LolA [Paenibacillus sp. MER TA 81-3]MCM3341540.1 outer membrane lipoprotein carrier protein LolA [Paenibacillus sp. MER TA 81-3]
MMIRSGLSLLLASSILISGCQGGTLGLQLSGEQIVDKVLEEGKGKISYYAESTSVTYENGKRTDEFKMKEWLDANTDRKRVEVTTNHDSSVSVNDGKRIVVLDRTKGEAYRMQLQDQAQPLTQREQVKALLESLRESHEFETLGEEKVGEWNTIHFKATAKKKSDLFQRMELWIDPKSWMVLKSIFESGPVTSENLYTKLDLSPEFTDDVFTLEIPDGVTVRELDDMKSMKNVSLPEAEAALGQSFLQWKQAEGKLAGIELYDMQGELRRTEITLNYWKDDKPYFMMSVFPAPEDEGDKDDSYYGEKVKVRGKAGTYSDTLRSVTWDEGGLRYTIYPDQNGMAKEQVLSIAGELQQ